MTVKEVNDLEAICSSCGNEFKVSITDTVGSLCPPCEASKMEEDPMFAVYVDDPADSQGHSDYEDNVDDQESDYFEAIEPEDFFSNK